MKKVVLSFIFLLSTSFFLSGLQASLYFLPIALPYFWFIILTYYSFKKTLLFSLVANLFHVFVLTSFTSLSISLLLIILNLITFAFVTLRERFHTNQMHISIASGAGCLIFVFLTWISQILLHPFYMPNFIGWLGTSLATLIVSVPLIFILNSIDQKIHFERIDTLENLRI